MPSDNATGEYILDDDEVNGFAGRKHKRCHVSCPELVDACCDHPVFGFSMDPFPYSRTEQLVGAHDTGGSFSSDGNAALFTDERPDAAYSPRRMSRLHRMNSVNQCALVWHGYTGLPWTLRCGVARLQSLKWNPQYLHLPPVGDTCIEHVIYHEPINPSFFLNAWRAMA